MLNESQLAEIRKYLLTKKLPIDILLEVQDHFIAQISSIQQDENLEFQKAFAKVKESWRKELTLSWKGEISLMDSTDFMRKMRKRIIYADIKQAAVFAIPYIIFLFIYANVTNQYFFKSLFLILFFIPTIIAIASFIYNFKEFKIVKKYRNNVLTLQQDGLMWFLFAIPPFGGVFFDLIKAPQKLQQMFLIKFESINIFVVILSTVILFYIVGGAIYSIICQRKFLKRIKIVKPFLKYLEEVS